MLNVVLGNVNFPILVTFYKFKQEQYLNGPNFLIFNSSLAVLKLCFHPVFLNAALTHLLDSLVA